MKKAPIKNWFELNAVIFNFVAMKRFTAIIHIIGVNPFVLIPENVLNHIFKTAKKIKGPIPVKGTINTKPFIQTLVRYSGEWRLYVNGPMLKTASAKVGDRVAIELAYDPAERVVPMHPKFKRALNDNQAAKKTFDSLAPSRQKEIVRYIANLKTEESVQKNITRAIAFLTGTGRFVGRDKPV